MERTRMIMLRVRKTAKMTQRKEKKIIKYDQTTIAKNNIQKKECL
jgi:hypothetical protein